MNDGRMVLIIPTYNEAENIERIVAAFLATGSGLEVLVADSDSPDETAAIVEKSFAGDDRVQLLRCDRRQGRGAAIVSAYGYLLEDKYVAIIATADADFSHDPADFKNMMAALKDCDVVIGSRYLKDSKIIGWPVKRCVFSRMANILARMLLRVGIRDYTNGYRMMRRKAVEELDMKLLDANGFIALSQELMQWKMKGMRIAEVPTKFVNRERGQSNFRLALVAESFWVLIKLAVFYQGRIGHKREI
jgi:dolichol-phosphate mannosyltransferase